MVGDTTTNFYFYGIFRFNQITNHCPEEWGNRKVPENQLRCFCSSYPGNLIFTIMQKQRNTLQHPLGSLCGVKRRKVKLPRYSRLNGRIIEELDALVSAVPAQRLSRNLRDIYLHYITMEREALPDHFIGLAEDLCFLFHLLDVIGDELPEVNMRSGH